MHDLSAVFSYAQAAVRAATSSPLAPALTPDGMRSAIPDGMRSAIPWAILLLRTLNMTLDTLRTLAVVRGRLAASWILGFAASWTFVVSTVYVFEGLSDVWRLLAYAGGYATGSVIGMAIEARFAPGHALLRVRSEGAGTALADALRREGYGATELAARQTGGAAGALVLSYVPRRHVDVVRRHLLSVDPACQVTAENVVQLRGGWRV